MSMSLSRAWGWAVEQFSAVELGDARRTARLVQMAAAACAHPSGKVAGVFPLDTTREGAYDFLENDRVDVKQIVEGLAESTARRCAELPFVFVPVDGTSITVSDRAGKKGMGNIGSQVNGARGL